MLITTYIALWKKSDKEVSFDWQNHRISSTDSKDRVTKQLAKRLILLVGLEE